MSKEREGQRERTGRRRRVREQERDRDNFYILIIHSSRKVISKMVVHPQNIQKS